MDESFVKVGSPEDGVVVVSPQGDIDMSRSPVLRGVIQEQFGQPSMRRLVIDLESVSYMDSSGLATLVEAMRTAKGGSVDLALAALHPRVRAVFEIAKLDTVFTITETLDEALSA